MPEAAAIRLEFADAPAVKDMPATANAEAVRVLLLLGALDGGGAERVAVNLMRHADPLAADIRIGVLRREGALLGDVEPQRLSVLDRWPRSMVEAAATPARLARMIAAARPDVLMTFGLGVDALAWPALRLMRRPPRWICREDSNPAAEYASLSGGAAGRAMAKVYLEGVRRAADAMVCVAADQAEALAARGWPRARVIANPIDLRRITEGARASLAVAPARPFVVAAGRLVRQKGFDILIRAFAAAAAARGMELVLLGEGPLEAELRALAFDLGVGDRVRFAGFQSNPWAWFARARLFVLSSRWEGFGNVVAEAMACGAPVLVSDCDFGPREQVSHGESGWVFPSQDIGALSAAMDGLLADRALCARLGEGARRRARAFDSAAIAGAYADLFRAEVAARRAPVAAAPSPTPYPRRLASAV